MLVHTAALPIGHDQPNEAETGKYHDCDPQPGVAVVAGLGVDGGAVRLDGQLDGDLPIVKVDGDGLGACAELLQRGGRSVPPGRLAGAIETAFCSLLARQRPRPTSLAAARQFTFPHKMPKSRPPQKTNASEETFVGALQFSAC